MDLMKKNKPLVIYFCIIALTALALGLSNDVLSNYFKDAYNVTTIQRGFIEFPRELPGVLLILSVSLLSFMSDIRMAMVAQLMSLIGILALGLFTPVFNVMLIFIFINSFGMHLFFPLQDSIGLSLVSEKNVGKRMGQFKGISTGFMMLGYIMVFLGFKYEWFSFKTPLKWVFIISGIILFVVFILFIALEKTLNHPVTSEHKVKLFLRREYKYYYILVIMFGVQKQIMMVYGPWVLIELLSKGAETFGILSAIGAFVGIFFLPAVGHWLDRFGVKKILFADALSFVGVYILYGLMSGMFVSGQLAKTGWPVLLMFVLFIVDKMSTQLGIVRSVYLKKILVKASDLTPTLSLGISLDHIMSITCAFAGGFVWKYWGPQYIFYLAAVLSLVNLYVAFKVQGEAVEGQRP